jgi:carbon storage regulator
MEEIQMLVLSRKCGEEIVIGQGEIRIEVLELKGGRVRLGVTAPRDVTVHRLEVALTSSAGTDTSPQNAVRGVHSRSAESAPNAV